jgi:hypothetical protein
VGDQETELPRNQRHLLAFTLGLLVPLFVSGLIVSFPLNLAVLEDVTLLLFFRYLFGLYPADPSAAGAFISSPAS